jgi:hypothetical protein
LTLVHQPRPLPSITAKLCRVGHRLAPIRLDGRWTSGLDIRESETTNFVPERIACCN